MDVRTQATYGLAALTVFLAGLALAFPDETLRSWLWFFYAVQYGYVLHVAFRVQDRWLFILSPSFVTVTYLAVTNFLGAFTFSKGIVLSKADYSAYLNWEYLDWTCAYLLFCNAAAVIPFFVCNRKDELYHPRKMVRRCYSPVEIGFTFGFFIFVLVLFSIVELDLSIIGGPGNWAVFPKTLAALALVITCCKYQLRGRFFIYLLILLGFASFSSEDKREAIFLIFPVALAECLRLARPRIRPKLIIVAGALAAFSLLLIVMMSINRGYGGYSPENFFDSRKYVVEYLKDESFYEYLLNNLEVNYTFYHSHQAVEYIFESPDLLQYGSTFLKILFLPVPRWIWPEKPESIIERYTYFHAPEYRNLGGSWISSMYSEYFWNFHFLGLIPLALFFVVATRCYLWLAWQIRNGIDHRHLFSLFAYMNMLELIRGAGLDQYCAYLAVAWCLSFGAFLPALKLIAVMQRQSGSSSPVSLRA